MMSKYLSTMKKYLILTLAVAGLSNLVYAQDCFDPPSGHTLYTTTDAAYNPPAISGFVSLGPDLSGSWSTVSTTGTVNLTFTDNTGRTSSQNLTGTGTVTIANTITNISSAVTTSCQQTFTVAEYTPVIEANPSITSSCPMNVVLVIDESESISANMSVDDVRGAIGDLVTALSTTGSSLAIVEFDSRARRVALNGSTGLQQVDASLMAAVETYLINDYNPVGDALNLIGGTNWEDALIQANMVAGADLVVMLTDGRPTFYNTPTGMNGVAGEGDSFDLTALKQAQDAANNLKASGKHLFLAGLDFPSELQPLIDISGTNQFISGQAPLDILSSDFTLIPPDELASLFGSFDGACVPVLIPTMGEWGVIILMLLIMILSVASIKTHTSPKLACS